MEAGQHRARLSRDLADRLATRAAAPADVIVTAGDDPSGERVQQLIDRHGARIKKRLRTAVVLEVSGEQLETLSADTDVVSVSGDVPVRAMGVTAEAIGADQVWQGGAFAGLRSYTGRGIGVAVIDTGVDAMHPRLRGHVVLSLDFTRGLRLGGSDENGHGTHVASLVREVAPNAHVISLKAMGADGSGKTSSVLEAFDWLIENRRLWNIKVVNVSLGHPVMESERDDPLCQAVRRATEAGILVTVAAGNLGKTPEGTADCRRDHVAGELALGADRRRAEHEADGAAVGRPDGDLQLARADGDRRRAEAGAGGAGEPAGGRGAAGRRICRGRIRTAWSAARRTCRWR